LAASVTAPDSSVLIAGYAPEHPFHDQAAHSLREVRETGRLIAHTMAEAYAVLSGRYSHPSGNVIRYLNQFIAQPPVGLAPTSYPSALSALAAGEVVGASVHDGLIAAAAAEAGLRLLSLDRRAARTYAAVGADYEILF
jgi:predicted nucleic acid-binding protein